MPSSASREYWAGAFLTGQGADNIERANNPWHLDPKAVRQPYHGGLYRNHHGNLQK